MDHTPASAPHLSTPNSVGSLMRQVLYALVPGTVILIYFFGIGPLLTLLLASAAALISEAIMLRLRKRPVLFFQFERPYFIFGVAIVLHQRNMARTDIGAATAFNTVKQVVVLHLVKFGRIGMPIQQLWQQISGAGIGTSAAADAGIGGRRLR